MVGGSYGHIVLAWRRIIHLSKDSTHVRDIRRALHVVGIVDEPYIHIETTITRRVDDRDLSGKLWVKSESSVIVRRTELASFANKRRYVGERHTISVGDSDDCSRC